jgi:hypothetical protein
MGLLAFCEMCGVRMMLFILVLCSPQTFKIQRDAITDEMMKMKFSGLYMKREGGETLQHLKSEL